MNLCAWHEDSHCCSFSRLTCTSSVMSEPCTTGHIDCTVEPRSAPSCHKSCTTAHSALPEDFIEESSSQHSQTLLKNVQVGEARLALQLKHTNTAGGDQIQKRWYQPCDKDTCICSLANTSSESNPAPLASPSWSELLEVDSASSPCKRCISSSMCCRSAGEARVPLSSSTA